MQCTECGSENDAVATICVVCGKVIGQHGQDELTPKQSAELNEVPSNSSVPTSSSASSETQTGFYKAILGEKNQAYYLKQFAHFDNKGGAGISWNWSAFFFSFCWLIYRRMGVGAILYFVMPIVYFILLLVMIVVVNKQQDLILISGVLLYAVVVIMLPALYANAIYYKRCNKIISKTCAVPNNLDRQLGELSAKGGVNNLKVIVSLYSVFFCNRGSTFYLCGAEYACIDDSVQHRYG